MMHTEAALDFPRSGVDVAAHGGRSTDLTKVHVPMPFLLTIVAICLGGAAGVWRIESKVNVIETAINYERQLDAERTQRATERENDYRALINQRFETLEAKIESAGLRNAAVAMSNELQKQRAK